MTELALKREVSISETSIDIKMDELLPGQYTVSLLNLALKQGLISPSDMQKVQLELLRIFMEVADAHTRGESSSLSVQTGEGLMTSIYYSLDAFVMNSDNPGGLVVQLMSGGNIRGWYEKGLKLVAGYVKDAEQLFRTLRREKLDIPLEAYHCTIDEGIPVFFPKYSPVFSAQDSMGSIDYPLLFDDMSVKGIFYMKNYLETLALETTFCRKFHREDMLKVLEAYGRVYGINYTKTLLNLFEIVLNNALFSVLSGGSAYRIVISEEQFEILEARLKHLNREETAEVLLSASKTLMDEMGIGSKEMSDYIERYIPLLTLQINQAKDNDSLKKLVIVPEEEEYLLEGLLLEAGERVSDAEFRKLVARVGKCRRSADKISLVMDSLHSLYDFIDLLEGDCLYGEEMGELFRRMGDAELAALVSVMSQYDRKNGEFNLRLFISRTASWETEWQEKLAEHLKSLDPKRFEAINQYIMTLRLFP